MNGSPEAAAFRLTVLNPGGRDPAQDFSDGAGAPDPRQHAPVNFHGYAACTGGTFQREVQHALAQQTPVLLLIRSDFKASERALVALKKSGRTVAVSLKETGLYQIAEQLSDPKKLASFMKIVGAADCCIACTPEAAGFYRAARREDEAAAVRFIPTPYPIDDPRWDFSRPFGERFGIFIGTREWEVPSRNHLAALLLARRISEQTSQPVTVYNKSGRKGARLLEHIGFRPGTLRVLDRYPGYLDYLREMAKHRVVLQLDASYVPGQVAGDALLCKLPCVGGNGAVDRLGFPAATGFGRDWVEIEKIALRLLTDDRVYHDTISQSRSAAQNISFAAVRSALAEFFGKSDPRAFFGHSERSAAESRNPAA